MRNNGSNHRIDPSMPLDSASAYDTKRGMKVSLHQGVGSASLVNGNRVSVDLGAVGILARIHSSNTALRKAAEFASAENGEV